jgi:hypothetical protein
MGGIMHTTRRASLLTVCIGILLLIGACSGGGTPVTADPGPDLSKYASTIEGTIYQNGGPASTGHVFVYNLGTFEQAFDAEVGSDGKYIAGADPGQYLVFPVSPTGWCEPTLESSFSSYINVEAGLKYRMDIELTNDLASGEELVFGFVTSEQNDKPIAGATVIGAGRSVRTDAYGFYVLAVPAGTNNFTIQAEGFYDLRQDLRNAQVSADFFKTPFFKLNPMNTTGASLGGVVRDVSTGNGLGGTRITLYNPENPNWIAVAALTNLGGEYRFFNLPEGIYKMYYERPGYTSIYRQGLVIKADDTVIINVFLQKDLSGMATVLGYVNNSSMPLPVGGARVTASDPLLGSYMTTTQPTGYYTISDVIPGNYSMTVVAPSSGGTTFYESASSFQTIVEGVNRIDFNLRFINEGVLRGTVAVEPPPDPPGFPPTGVEVTAEKVGGPLTGVKFRTTTDGKGQFVFNGLLAGIYVVKGQTNYGSTEDFYGQVTDVVVNAGDTTDIDLTITKQ